MVSSFATNESAPDPSSASEIGIQQVRQVPSRVNLCPRCDTRLVKGYDEPRCLSCGYTDYSYAQNKLNKNKSNLLSAATRYVLRYVGDFPNLAETLTQVKLIRVRNRIIYAVSCPFCTKAMDESALSGKRPDIREQRYKCMDGHRVSLIPSKEGSLGWK